MKLLAIDFETRSWRDIADGAPAYAEDPTTEVMCASFADEAGTVESWVPGEELPAWVAAAFADPEVALLAHNASFELSILASVLCPQHGWPDLPLDRWIDTMQLAQLHGLPASLENACEALKLPQQKDTEGGDLMLKFCRPRKVGGEMVMPEPTFFELERIKQYCEADVRATVALFQALGKVTPEERAVQLVDREINQRGVCVDLDLAERMSKLAALRADQLAADMRDATGDKVTLTNTPALKAWLTARGVELPTAKRKRVNGEVVETISLALSSVQQLLARADVQADADVVQVLRARVAASKLTSLAKLDKLARMANRDGRLRCLLRYHGAHTGRWTSSGVQLHNLPKSKLKASMPALREILLAYDGRTKASGETALRALEAVGGDVLSVFSQMLRSLIVAAPGHEFIGADYSAIEARVLAWLANEGNVLDTFERREDIYVADAAAIGSTDRQLGKVCRLALGYGMGAVKFLDTAAGYGVTLDAKRAQEVVRLWREANTNTVDFWAALESAFLDALGSPGKVFSPRPDLHFCAGGGMVGVKLPSGRVLRYYQPRVMQTTRKVEVFGPGGARETKEVEMREIRFFRPGGRGWQPDSTYGGKLAENVTQAIARDLLAAALVRLRSSMYTPVLHVHDSVVSEVAAKDGNVQEFCDLITALPPWASGLPMAAEGYRASYFKG